VSAADVAALRERLTRRYAGSGEHAALAVFLGYAPITARGEFHGHVDADGVDWAAVLAGPWSSTELFLIETAYGLWSGRRIEIDLWRAGVLDDAQYLLWQAMLTAYRTGQVPYGPAGQRPRGPGREAAR
jgi:hypothetical protein